MPTLTTENFGELMQPTLDRWAEEITQKIDEVLPDWQKDTLEKAAAAGVSKDPEVEKDEDSDVTFDINDPAALEAQLAKVQLEKAKQDLDLKDPEAVRTFLAKLEKASAKVDVDDPDALRAHLERLDAERASNQVDGDLTPLQKSSDSDEQRQLAIVEEIVASVNEKRKPRQEG